MFRPYMAIIRFFLSFPLRFRYINCDVEISHPIIILVCLCIGGYYITLIYISIYIFSLSVSRGGLHPGGVTPPTNRERIYIYIYLCNIIPAYT